MSSEVNVSSQKFNIKLFVPEADGMTELWLQLESVCIVFGIDVLYTGMFLLLMDNVTFFLRRGCMYLWGHTSGSYLPCGSNMHPN